MDPYVAPPIELLRVGFGKRFLAYVIDTLIMLTLSTAVGILAVATKMSVPDVVAAQLEELFNLYTELGIDGGAIRFMESMFGGMLLASLALGVIYPLIEGITGASPGKRILSICVATPDGREADLRIYLRRYVVKNLGKVLAVLALVPTLGLLGTISTLYDVVFFLGCFIALGSTRLTLHDMIAQTAVFHRSDIQPRS